MEIRFGKNQILTIFFVSLLLGILVTLFFSTRSVIESGYHPKSYVGISVLFTFVVSISISLASFPVFSGIAQRFSWKENPTQRGLLSILAAITIPSFIITFWVYLFDKIFGRIKVVSGPVQRVDYFDHIVTAVIITVFLVMLYELRQLYIYWRDSLLEKEKLKREALEFKYTALTTQLDPHFMFNALNTLSGMVRAKDDKAIRFIDHFSDVYRYVLYAQEQNLVTVSEEISLVTKYLALQKIRYNDNLQYSIQINYDDNEKLLPPLSVQLLVENAIKHNIISNDKPLEIKIISNENHITVLNNQQLRSTQTTSGKGQKILEQRFAHFGDSLPEFWVEEERYFAKIPLIDEE